MNGFTLKNGYALDVDPYYRGGGMYLYDSSPALTGITFSDNEANFRNFMKVINRDAGGLLLETMTTADIDGFLADSSKQARAA